MVHMYAGVRAGVQHTAWRQHTPAGRDEPHLWLHAHERLLCARHPEVGVCPAGPLQRQELCAPFPAAPWRMMAVKMTMMVVAMQSM